MWTCPLRRLHEALEWVIPHIPKPRKNGSFEKIWITEEEFLDMLKKLSQVDAWTASFSKMECSEVSITWNRIYNFLREQCFLVQLRKVWATHIATESFLHAACTTLDQIMRETIDWATDFDDLQSRLVSTREILKKKSLFFWSVEDAIHDYFPHRVHHILEKDYGNALWKALCPAYKLMDTVCNAIFPHYIARWRTLHNG